MESLKLLNTIKNRLFFLPAIFIYFFWSSGHIFHTLTARPIEIFWIDSLRRIWWCWSSGGSTGSFIRMSLQCFSCLLSPPFKVSITGKIRPKSIAAIWSHWSHSGLRVVILVVVVVVISWTLIKNVLFFCSSGTPSLGSHLADVISGIQYIGNALCLANNAFRQPCVGDGPGFEPLIRGYALYS